MATNYMKAFATSSTANVATDTELSNSTEVLTGFSPNTVADSAMINKLFQISNSGAYALGNLVVNYAKTDANPSNASALYTNLELALKNITKSTVQGINNIYGVCNTTSETVAKAVTIPDFVLTNGSFILVKFVNGNTATNPTLNVNGTGAKPLYCNGAYLGSNQIALNSTVPCVYNGSQWELCVGVAFWS